MIYAIILIIWMLGIVPAYKKIKDWDNKEWEKVVFGCIWPLIIPLYYIWKLFRTD